MLRLREVEALLQLSTRVVKESKSFQRKEKTYEKKPSKSKLRSQQFKS